MSTWKAWFAKWSAMTTDEREKFLDKIEADWAERQRKMNEKRS